MKKIWAIVRKDLTTEYRTKEIFSSMFTFALLIIVVFNFTVSFSSELVRAASPAMLWISFTFAGVLGLSRSFALEKEGGSITGVLLTPTDRSLVYFGKMTANMIFLFVVELLILPMFILFFNLDFTSALAPILLILFLGTIGFVSVGTLFSAMALNTRLREVLLPILLFPIIIPVIVASVKLTGAVLEGKTISSAEGALQLLISFDLIFLAVSAVVFEFVVEES